MLGEAKLDLEWINPLAGDFDQVIGAAAEEIKAVGIPHKAVAGVDPAALADGLRRLVRPVPVQRRRGIAAHPHDAFFVVADLAADFVFQRDLVAGHPKPRSPNFLLVRAVGEIDVQLFGGTEAFDDLKAREVLPGIKNVGRKHFGGR